MENIKRIRDYKTGRVLIEIIKENNLLSCLDRPAWVEKDATTGVLIWESWFFEGQQHRINGAADIVRDASTGILLREEWHQAGILHRADGPAIIVRNPETGDIIEAEIWIDGIRQRSPLSDQASSLARDRSSAPSNGR